MTAIKGTIQFEETFHHLPPLYTNFRQESFPGKYIHLKIFISNCSHLPWTCLFYFTMPPVSLLLCPGCTERVQVLLGPARPGLARRRMVSPCLSRLRSSEYPGLMSRHPPSSRVSHTRPGLVDRLNIHAIVCG